MISEMICVLKPFVAALWVRGLDSQLRVVILKVLPGKVSLQAVTIAKLFDALSERQCLITDTKNTLSGQAQY